MQRQLTASMQKEAFHLKLSGLFAYYYFFWGGGEREREKIMYICIGDENPLKGYRKGDAKNFQRVIFAYDQVLCELRFFSNETSADGSSLPTSMGVLYHMQMHGCPAGVRLVIQKTTTIEAPEWRSFTNPILGY